MTLERLSDLLVFSMLFLLGWFAFREAFSSKRWWVEAELKIGLVLWALAVLHAVVHLGG